MRHGLKIMFGLIPVRLLLPEKTRHPVEVS